MEFNKDTQATLYREDPRYVEDGIPGTRLSARDAYVDIEEIKLDGMFEETDFLVRAKESKSDGKPTLPITEPEGEFSFMEAYGFFYKIIDVRRIDQTRVFEIIAHYSPEGLLDSHVPLTATHIGDGKFKLDRSYSHDMPKPAGVRGHSKMQISRIVQLVKDSNEILVAKDRKINFDDNERIKILVNWDPSAIQYGKPS